MHRSDLFPRAAFTFALCLSAAALIPDSSIAASSAAPLKASPALTLAQILEASRAADWRSLDPQNTLYLELPNGRVVIELAPNYAPRHIANIKALVAEKYFDGLAMMRSQDNYVAQWGDPDESRKIQHAQAHLPAEFSRRIDPALAFYRLPDRDTYAPQTGLSDGFPVARDPAEGRTWMTHCYGMVGAGRDNASDSGGGSELYVVTGHAPRHLDRNVTLVGRVVQGMPLLSTLPRGTGALGFYEKPEQRVPITAVRLAADVAVAERSVLEVLRTDTATFRAVVQAQRFRGGEWYKYAAGHIEVCNVPIPVRTVQQAPH